MIASVLLVLAVFAGFAVVMTKDMAPAAPKVLTDEEQASAKETTPAS